MPSRFTIALMMILPCQTFADDLTLDRLTALAKTYFRDSAEIPMTVAITAIATDNNGKVKHQSQTTAGMVFRGYNLESGKFSLRANASMMHPGALGDSLPGDLAAFMAGGILLRKKDSAIEITPGLVVLKDKECSALELMPRWFFPAHPCGAAQLILTSTPTGDPMFQRFSFDSLGAPASANGPHLGSVQLLSYHTTVEFQLKKIPNEAKPYLWPLETVVTALTNKGKLTMTNRYSPKN